MQKPSEVVLVTCGATTIDHARFCVSSSYYSLSNVAIATFYIG